MDNETPKSDQVEEEYHFSPETENSSAFAAATPTAGPANAFDRLKRKNIMIGVGVVVVAFCVYKVFDVLMTKSHSPRSVSTAIVAPPIFPSTANTSNIAAPTPVSQMPTADVSSTELKTRLSDLENRQTQYQESIDKLTSQVNDIQSSVSGLNTQLSSLTESMQTLANQFAQQQAQAAAEKEAAEKKIAQKKIHVTPKPIYFVRSMIPGRAWLLTKGGETITVSVGNNLPGYGVVQIIDPTQGTVTTSAGAIIGYSPDEN